MIDNVNWGSWSRGQHQSYISYMPVADVEHHPLKTAAYFTQHSVEPPKILVRFSSSRS